MDVIQLILEYSLPIIILLISLLEILVIPLLGKISTRRKLRRFSVSVVILLTTLLLVSVYPEVIQSPMEWRIANVFGNGIVFRIDLLSLLFMIFAGVIFLVVNLYTVDEIKGRGREKSFYLFFMLTYISTIGTLMAGDLISFLMFFEIMTFASYVLMVHQRGQKVLEAGKVYIYFGIIGGLSILAGILVLSSLTQNYEWVTIAEKYGEFGGIKYVSAALFILGFGIKAGMAPLHHWVPVIYPKSHLSVNALSSGILMKIGGYGILRLFVSVIESAQFRPDLNVQAMMITLEEIGFVVIWLGVFTMVVGVISALEQENMVRMLAYHSVSQMGYVIMAIGVAAYLGFDGSMGFAGATYHMINHGIFKSLLFMVAGTVYFKTKEKNMYRIGGLSRQMPFTALIGIIAAFGITGMPFFNGFASKSLIHHAVAEAHLYGHSSFVWAEYIFIFVSACTAASFIKLISQVFFGEKNEKFKDVKDDYNLATLGMVILAIAVILIGVFPNALLDHFIIPAATSLNFDLSFIEQYLMNINLFNMSEFTNMIVIYILGMIIYTVGVRFKLFHFHLPKRLDLESGYYTPMFDRFILKTRTILNKMEEVISNSDVFIYGVMLLVMILLSLNFFTG
ncbi:complex I subunit 5 family protein [Amphibacillus indicireducens]|uniref:Proton-conducting transporter membrane subunit n=1 Tax=Amphibacillus indicireducens TaxID=1076330 RepID=A0ABP7V6E3_9BACI